MSITIILFFVTFRSHCQCHICQRPHCFPVHGSVYDDKVCRWSIFWCTENWNEEIRRNGVNCWAWTFRRSNRWLKCTWHSWPRLVFFLFNCFFCWNCGKSVKSLFFVSRTEAFRCQIEIIDWLCSWLRDCLIVLLYSSNDISTTTIDMK